MGLLDHINHKKKGVSLLDTLEKVEYMRPKKVIAPEPTPPIKKTLVNRTSVKQPQQPQHRSNIKTLLQLGIIVVQKCNSITKEEIIQGIIEHTNVDKLRALKGFDKLLKEKIIVKTIRERFYLKNSTPF